MTVVERKGHFSLIHPEYLQMKMISHTYGRHEESLSPRAFMYLTVNEEIRYKQVDK